MNDKQALKQTVNLARQLASTNIPYTEIAKQLNDGGHTTEKGRPWTEATVSMTLLRHGFRKRRTARTKKTKPGQQTISAAQKNTAKPDTIKAILSITRLAMPADERLALIQLVLEPHHET